MVGLLISEAEPKQGQTSNRESAAVALTKLAMLSDVTQGEVLFNLCAASSLPINGQKIPPSFIVPLKRLFSSEVESENSAATQLAAQVIKGMNLKVAVLCYPFPWSSVGCTTPEARYDRFPHLRMADYTPRPRVERNSWTPRHNYTTA